MMAFQGAPKEFYGFSFIPSCGFQLSFGRACGAADCCCKTCRRELGGHFLPVSATSLPQQKLAAGRVQLRGGGEKN